MRIRPIAACALLCLAAFAAPTHAQDAAAPAPDRIVLNSGDVLTGTVTSVQDGVLTLATELLGDLEIAVGNIAEADVETPIVVHLSGGNRVEGRIAQLGADDVVLTTADGSQRTLAYADMISADLANPSWTGAFALGASLSTGNANKRLVSSSFDAVRRSEFDRWTAKATWIYEEQRVAPGTYNIIDRILRGSLKYDYFLSERLYAFGSGQADADLSANIRRRYNIGAGLGYQWVENDDVEFSTDAGLGYLSQEFRTNDPNQESVSARLAYALGWQILDSVELLQDVEYFPSLETSANYLIRKNTRLRVDLGDSLFAQFQWLLDHNSTPATGNDRTDNKYLLSVGWEF